MPNEDYIFLGTQRLLRDIRNAKTDDSRLIAEMNLGFAIGEDIIRKCLPDPDVPQKRIILDDNHEYDRSIPPIFLCLKAGRKFRCPHTNNFKFSCPLCGDRIDLTGVVS